MVDSPIQAAPEAARPPVVPAVRGGSSFGAGGSVGSGGGGSTGGVAGAPTPEEIYGILCSECHGPTGDGIEGEGPDIKHPIRDYAEWVVRNGRGAADDAYGVFALYYDDDMDAVPVAAISDENLQGIFDFLDSPPQPTTGEGLYKDYCAACHGPDAQGGLTDRPIAEETAEFLDNVREGHHSGEFSNRHDHMPAQSVEDLSDAEIQLIADYVSSL